jgi:hypothetical protein
MAIIVLELEVVDGEVKTGGVSTTTADEDERGGEDATTRVSRARSGVH